MKDFFKKIISSILIFEAKSVLKKYKPFIIAVTGTVGKTSTKDAIFTVLSPYVHIRKSEKSFNSEIGVPLTILGCPNGWGDPFIWISNFFTGLELMFFKSDYPKVLVLEIGADHPGDIQSISEWLKTDISVITKVGNVPVHVEFFSSPEEVLREKSFLISALKNDGTLILYADDKKVAGFAREAKQKVVTFGIEEISTVRATDIETVYDNEKMPQGIFFNLIYKDLNYPIRIDGILGFQQVYPLVAGAAVGIAYGLSLDKVAAAFDKHVAPKGRMNILKGINNSVIIDDSYNSSPDALKEALRTLASLQVSGKRVAVLGDMLELGQYSVDEHRKAGIIAKQSCDILLTVGHRSKAMSESGTNFANSIEAAQYLKSIIENGDVILVKGSQSMRTEKIVKAIMAEPEKASELLVRQEEEWLAKK